MTNDKIVVASAVANEIIGQGVNEKQVAGEKPRATKGYE